MGTLLRVAAIALPCLALLATAPAGAGPRPPVCDLLESHGAYISGGGLMLLTSHCNSTGPGAGQLQGGPPGNDDAWGPTQPQWGPAAIAPEGPDRRLNDPAMDQPPATTQSETVIETCGQTVLAAWNDSGSSPSGSFTGYARSADGGGTWQDMGPVPGLTGSDPALAADRSCRFYFSAITFLNGCSRIGVVRSDDGGLSWSAPAVASPGTSCGNFQDKEWIDVDATAGPHSGNVYVCWDDRGTSQIRVLFSRSTDGGQTFSAPLVIDAFGSGFATGCQVAVGPGGEVVVVWTEGQTLGVYSRTSTDGGQNFGPRNAIAFSQVIGRFDVCGESFRPLLNGNIRTFNWPALAVSPATGSIHVAWNDNRGGNPDIFHSRSTDGGAHWTQPRRLNDDAGTVDQFQPALAFTESGVLRAIWYDRRLDPAANYLIDVYSTASADDGATFGANERITDVSFGVPPIRPNFDPSVVPCYMGDYIGITGSRDTHYMAWGDNRGVVGGRLDPDVYFDVRSAAGRSITVTRTDDPPPGFCEPGDCTLREAVTAANQSPGADTITLPAGYYSLQRTGRGEDAGERGDIDIAGSLAIRGAGARLTTVDAEGLERVFDILPGVTAEISGMTVTGGATSAGNPLIADGGGILNRGNLSLDGIYLTGNATTGIAFGGGIHNAGTLVIANSTISGNTAGAGGGGVYNALNLTIVNTTISANEALTARGGGLSNASRASLNNVTLVGNVSGLSSPLRSGNLANASTGDLTVSNTVIAAGGEFNCSGPIVSLGHNIEDGETCGLDAEGDLPATDPRVLPLSDNGGPAPTHALDSGSPARDAGSPACERGDQRGYVRPADGDGDNSAVCDMGALEMDARPMGDVNCDFHIGATDALGVVRYVAGAGPFGACLLEAGDADCDATITLSDALVILRRVAGLPAQQPPGCPRVAP